VTLPQSGVADVLGSGCRPGVFDDVALDAEGGEISGADYALGFVDLIKKRDRHRAHLNLAY
jgi:putative NADH-flavin reductase